MLDVQRRLAAQILKCGKNRIWFDPGKLEEIKEAITKTDIRSLIGHGTISKKATSNTSKYHARIRKQQKIKSKQKGHGSRKGKKTARLDMKREWMNKIRLQRRYIQKLRDSGAINLSDYHELYSKSKGSFFRSLRHLKFYVQEKSMVKNG